MTRLGRACQPEDGVSLSGMTEGRARVRIEELVGQRIRDRREELNMRQEEFGRRLAPLLGKAWSRQAVSSAEQGKRAFTAAELVAIGHVLEMRPARLLRAPAWVEEVELPTGSTVPVKDMPEMPQADQYIAKLMSLVREFHEASMDMSKASAELERSSKRASSAGAQFIIELEDTFGLFRLAQADLSDDITTAGAATQEAVAAYEKLIAASQPRADEEKDREDG